MDFRKPEEDDKGETFDNGRSPRDPPEEGSASITEETVRFGEEDSVAVGDALELIGDTLTQPEEFGLVKLERVRKLEDENKKLRKENDDLREELEQLRGDVAALWASVSKVDKQGRHAVPLDSSTGMLPESFSTYDPAGVGGDE